MKHENKLLNYYSNLYQREYVNGDNTDCTLMMYLGDIIFLSTRCQHYRRRIGKLKKQVQTLNKQLLKERTTNDSRE